MDLEEFNIYKRISEGEGQQLDFKFAITDSKKLLDLWLLNLEVVYY